MSGIENKDAATRKSYPITRGCLDYFPDALLYVAMISRRGNEQHNPGQEMHWARGKSTDHADCVVRHVMDRGGFDLEADGSKTRHSGKAAWRALALLQEELEAAGEAPLARGARLPEAVPVMVPKDNLLDPDKMPWLPRCSAPGAICPTEDPRKGEPNRRKVRNYDLRDARMTFSTEFRETPTGRRRDDFSWTTLPEA